MTRDQVLERFCNLTTEVMKKRFNAMEAADCFCGTQDLTAYFKAGCTYQFSEKIVKYIEDAVREKLQKEKPPQDEFVCPGFWECPVSMNLKGYCIYNRTVDPAMDDCIFCHEPHERK